MWLYAKKRTEIYGSDIIIYDDVIMCNGLCVIIAGALPLLSWFSIVELRTRKSLQASASKLIIIITYN